MEFFEQLGSQIERRWREQQYHEASFPQIAADALEEAQINENVRVWDILRWLQNTSHLPAQEDLEAKFGEPPITLYNGSRFHIEIYFWLDGTTSVHQHSFAGAFQVFQGESIHSQYTFDQTHKINSNLAIGDVNFSNVEVLKVGDVRKIFPGKDFIHALFHLDRPSVTIIVRTRTISEFLPQYDYLKPHIAWNPFFRDNLTVKKLQTISMLLKLGHPEVIAFIKELLEKSDFQTSFSILRLLHNDLYGGGACCNQLTPDRFREFVDVALRKHGERVRFIPLVLDEQYKQYRLMKLRSTLTNNEQRFLLALLLNVPSRAQILNLVQSRFPQIDAVDKVIEMLKEISAITKIHPIEIFEGYNLSILRKLLEGFTADQIMESVPDRLWKSKENGKEKGVEALSAFTRQSLLLRQLSI